MGCHVGYCTSQSKGLISEDRHVKSGLLAGRATFGAVLYDLGTNDTAHSPLSLSFITF